LKSRKVKSIWLRSADDKSIRFLRKLLTDKFLRPVLVLSEEPMSAQELIELGINYLPYDLEFYGVVERFRDNIGRVKYRLTKQGVSLSISLKQLILTLDENLKGDPNEDTNQENISSHPSDPLYIP